VRDPSTQNKQSSTTQDLERVRAEIEALAKKMHHAEKLGSNALSHSNLTQIGSRAEMPLRSAKWRENLIVNCSSLLSIDCAVHRTCITFCAATFSKKVFDTLINFIIG
jgi:hypothetical protein